MISRSYCRVRVELSLDSQQRRSSSSEDRSVRVCVCCMVESGGYHPSSEGTASASPGLPLSLRTDTAPAPAPTPPSDPSSLTVLQPPPGSFQPAFTHHYTGKTVHSWNSSSEIDLVNLSKDETVWKSLKNLDPKQALQDVYRKYLKTKLTKTDINQLNI